MSQTLKKKNRKIMEEHPILLYSRIHIARIELAANIFDYRGKLNFDCDYEE